MKSYQLKSMTNGWFVGDFLPTAFRTQAVEVAVKCYRAGDREERHFHKIATELTLIISGQVRMNKILVDCGQIVLVAPNESTDFEAVTDVTTVVVKVPSAINDKYLGSCGDSTS